MTDAQHPMTNQSRTPDGPRRALFSLAPIGGEGRGEGAASWGQTRPTRALLRHWLFGLLFASLTFARAAQCPACTVPVFRYGLDNWQADAFRLEVPASALTDPKLADFFRNLGTAQPANLEVKTGSSTEARLLFPHPEESKSPVLWTGALTPASLAALIDSPARKEIARRVLAGESVVWVLAESGNKAEDDAIAARVEKRLRYLEQVAILPRIDPNDPSSKLGPGPALRVKFSLLRVPGAPVSDPARSKATQPNAGSETGAPSETLLLKMLAGPKPAAELATGPWLAAVFGRGRVLGAWPATDFGDAEIEEASLFLLGACSCQVKRQNPGWDMLMNVNWTEELIAAAQKATATGATPVPAATPDVTVEPVTVKIQPQAATPAAPTERPWPLMWVVAGFAVVMGVWLRKSGRP